MLQPIIHEAKNHTNVDGIMNDPLSEEEVNLTFNTCTGASGPDLFHSTLIDNADRQSLKNACCRCTWPGRKVDS